AAMDEEALSGFRTLMEHVGNICALISAHAVFGAMELAKTMKNDQHIVVCLRGRCDKGIQSAAKYLPVLGHMRISLDIGDYVIIY
ncbi:hypothetical protein ASPBRDRAFT_127921, partial [Aspergillus brasiliensis CBS 101740]